MSANTQESDLEIRKREIELGQALARLKTNPDFQLVIVQEYMMKTLLEDSGDLIDMNPALRQQTMEEIMSVKYLQRKLEVMQTTADNAGEDE